MANLTNKQIATLANQAYSQFTAQEDITQLDLTEFTDTGASEINESNRDQFTKSLIGVCTKNWFTDTSYRSEYNDIFFVDNERFGAIIQMVSAKIPDAIDNSAWQQFVSGTSTVGSYTVYLPVVDTKYYTKTTSWAIPITISWSQWDTAFHNESELNTFISYVMMMVDNALLQHLEDMNDLNRNNFIGEKIAYSESSNSKGVHVVNIVEKYCVERGLTEGNRDLLLNNKDFLTFASAYISETMSYFKKQTALFNTEQMVRFTPDDRLACQMLKKFESKMESVALSNTWHNEFINLPSHQTVPFWQSTDDLSFTSLSAINVKTSNGEEINRDGIVGFICDKWAIAHTIRSTRVGLETKNIENVTLYEYQHRDSYMNNLTMNAVVFTMNDYTGT